MISPNEIENIDMNIINKLEKEIDESIKQFHTWYPWERAIIIGEYSVQIRNAIGRKYVDAGWNYVYHRTSSEHGEAPGLTSFIFSTTEIEPRYLKCYIRVK